MARSLRLPSASGPRTGCKTSFPRAHVPRAQGINTRLPEVLLDRAFRNVGDATRTNRSMNRVIHRPSGFRIRPWVLFTAVAAAWIATSCTSPTAPAPPPSGGNTLKLSFTEFSQTVEPVLVRQGCDAGGDCHGGGIRGNLILSPQGAKDVMFDFNQVVLEVSPTDRVHSLILTKPLAIAAGGVPHSFKPFATTADTDYVAILKWINDGVLQ
jgi:hypothetical protein